MGNAFTLLEVVLAIGLTVGLMAAVLGFYQHVSSVREDFDGQLREVRMASTHRSAMDRMTEELRSAVSHPSLPLVLEGGQTELRWAKAAVPGAAVWATVNVTDAPVTPEQDVRMVGYRVRQYEDEYGNWIIEGLERLEQRVLTAQVVEEGEQIRSALLAPQYKFIAFRYWDSGGQQWVTGWSGREMPAAVEISLGREPLPEQAQVDEYPYETVRRVVYLPGVRRAAPSGNIVRGLGGGR
jgi:hypothetical protein